MDKQDERVYTVQKTSETTVDKNGATDTTENVMVETGRRFHFIWLVILMFGMAMMIIAETYSQYLVARFVKEIQEERDDTDLFTSATNQSSTESGVMIEAQARAATVKIFLSLSSGIPSIVTIFILGAVSDRVGRKMLFILPCCGFFVLSATYAIVSFWNLPVYFIYIGHFIEGATGSFITLLIGAFAYTSDLTKGGNRRSLGITAVETVMIISLGITDAALGHVIHSLGYTVPFLISGFLLCLTVVIIICALPESRFPTTKKPLNIKRHFYSTFRFYYSKRNNNPRFKFIVCACIFFLLGLVALGKPSVDILFMLNSPLNWDSRKIGYFGTAHRCVLGLGSLILVGVLQRWCSDAVMGFLSSLSFIAGAVVQAFAWDDVLMFTAIGVGCFSTAGMSMVRSVLSKLTPQGQHGAMFGGIAVIEAVTMLTTGTVFTAIYRSTLSLFHGAVFLVMAATLTIASILFIVLAVSMRRSDGGAKVFVLSVIQKEPTNPSGGGKPDLVETFKRKNFSE